MQDSEFRFKVVEEKFGSNLSYKLLDSDTGEFVTILPFLGGAINSMALKHNDKLIEILDGYTSESELKETLNTSFKGVNLFPFPNRIRDAKYTFADEEQVLDMNFPQESNAIHGLVFNKPFKVVDAEDGEIGCILALEYSSEPMPGYPYEYLLKVVYKLGEGSNFECSVKVSNLMDQSIPIGHGWHPYFTAGSSTINELSFQFPAEKLLDVDDRNIPTGKKTDYTVFNSLKTIGDTQLDNCFTLSEEDEKATIKILNNTNGFAYTIWQEVGKYKYNFLQVYTPPHRKSIAIEPMTCAPDAFNNEDGLIILGPLENITTSFGITGNSEN